MPFITYVTNILQINLPCIVFRSYFGIKISPSPPQKKPHYNYFITTVTLWPSLWFIFFYGAMHCQALIRSLHCLHTNLWWGQSIKLLHHAEGNSGGANLSHSLLSLTEELKEQLELDKSWLRNWLHFWSEIKDSLSSDGTSFCPLGPTPLPLQMLASGQSLSSTSGPRHWLSSSSSLETGWPDSRSKQALKRLWIETILLPPTTPAWEALCCREADGKQGEHGVHSDHSLRMTERR